jgi:glycosyltransferase involved in cell wall biosynthesis
MKLVVEVTTCTPERAGIGYYTEHLVDALIATAEPGDEVLLIGNRELAPGAAAKWAGRLRLGGAPIRYLWMQRDAGRLIEEAGADFALFPNYLAPLAAPCPYVNIVHDLALIRTPQFFNTRKRVLVRPILPLVARAAVAVGTVSETSRRDVVSLLGIAEDRILMLPGAPHPACGPVTPSEIARVRARYGIGRPYVLTVGTLEPRKNLPMLLRAFDRLRAAVGTPAAELDLVTVGAKGWRDRELRAELAARLSSGRVHMLGYVPEEDLVALYGGATVMAYPSHFEGFGLPLIEAMACGTPVVATDVEALRCGRGDWRGRPLFPGPRARGACGPWPEPPAFGARPRARRSPGDRPPVDRRRASRLPEPTTAIGPSPAPSPTPISSTPPSPSRRSRAPVWAPAWIRPRCAGASLPSRWRASWRWMPRARSPGAAAKR